MLREMKLNPQHSRTYTDLCRQICRWKLRKFSHVLTSGERLLTLLLTVPTKRLEIHVQSVNKSLCLTTRTVREDSSYIGAFSFLMGLWIAGCGTLKFLTSLFRPIVEYWYGLYYILFYIILFIFQSVIANLKTISERHCLLQSSDSMRLPLKKFDHSQVPSNKKNLT